MASLFRQGRLAAATTVNWLPDCFGFSPALPQLLNLAGLDSFFTHKTNWSETQQAALRPLLVGRPRWQRGCSRIPSTTPPAATTARSVRARRSRRGGIIRGKYRNPESLLLFGWGDGGGGPTEDMLERIRQLADFPAMPALRHVNVSEWFAEIMRSAPADADLPVWVGEIYLELHRGTLTTQGRTKYLHRRAERALITAETLASMAAMLGAPVAPSLEQHWRVLLRNEFHDIMPGSSIREVYETGRSRTVQSSLPREWPPQESASGRDRSKAGKRDAAPALLVRQSRSLAAAAPDRLRASTLAGRAEGRRRQRHRRRAAPCPDCPLRSFSMDGLRQPAAVEANLLENAFRPGRIRRRRHAGERLRQACGRECLAGPRQPDPRLCRQAAQLSTPGTSRRTMPRKARRSRRRPARNRRARPASRRDPSRPAISATARSSQTHPALGKFAAAGIQDRHRLARPPHPAQSQVPACHPRRPRQASNAPTASSAGRRIATPPGIRRASRSRRTASPTSPSTATASPFSTTANTATTRSATSSASACSARRSIPTRSPTKAGKVSPMPFYPHGGDWLSGGVLAEAEDLNQPLLWQPVRRTLNRRGRPPAIDGIAARPKRLQAGRGRARADPPSLRAGRRTRHRAGRSAGRLVPGRRVEPFGRADRRRRPSVRALQAAQLETRAGEVARQNLRDRAMAHVVVSGLVKKYGALEVVHGVDFEIGDGEFVVLVGPSGCGKSTILRMIAGLETITGGDDPNRRPRRQRCAAARPRYCHGVSGLCAVPAYVGAAEFSASASKCAARRGAKIDAAVKKTAQILQIEELLDRRPKELSGGQRQRVAIGRAIAREPELFLFDEPLSNLDAKLRVDMRTQIKRLHMAFKTTSIYVTHDQTEAMTLADRIVASSERSCRADRHAVRTLRQAAQPFRGRLHRLADDEFCACAARRRG